ncbi:hypothetical protein LC55x_4601 [Lysobacter capsici]|nr:hypothetical protein LC55x_4601 [Lysobacter capsici]
MKERGRTSWQVGPVRPGRPRRSQAWTAAARSGSAPDPFIVEAGQ